MKIITSVHNDHVKHIIHLSKKSYRLQHQQFVIEGTRAYNELIQIYKPIAVYITQTYVTSHQDITYNSDHTIIVTEQIMKKISTATTPSGICAIFPIPASKKLPTKGPGIILMNIQDPGNMGTLIRTAAAMNIKEVLIIQGADPYHPKVIQSTAGCLASVNMYQTTLQEIQQHQTMQLCALIVQGGKKPQELNLKDQFLVVGNEAQGLSEEQLAVCQETMTIPMPGNTESLNAAVAGSIGLYIMSQQN